MRNIFALIFLTIIFAPFATTRSCSFKISFLDNCAKDCLEEDGKFHCSDQSGCLRAAQVCDGKEDCNNGDDEKEFCETSCKRTCPENQSCMHNSGNGTCFCNQGYKMENGTCVDIDECQEFGICSHHCINTPGAYYCSCFEGFNLTNAGGCVPAEDEADIFFSTRSEIQVITHQTNITKKLSIARNLQSVNASDLNEAIG